MSKKALRGFTTALDVPNAYPGKPRNTCEEVLKITLKEPTCGRIRIAGDMEHPISSWTVRHILRKLREQGKTASEREENLTERVS